MITKADMIISEGVRRLMGRDYNTWYVLENIVNKTYEMNKSDKLIFNYFGRRLVATSEADGKWLVQLKEEYEKIN